MKPVPINERTYHRFIWEYAVAHNKEFKNNTDNDANKKMYKEFICFDRNSPDVRIHTRYVFFFKKDDLLYHTSRTKNKYTDTVPIDDYRMSYFILTGIIDID